MTPHNSSKPQSDRAVWIAAAIGLAGGLLLSIPLSRTVNQGDRSFTLLPITNPFASWSVFGTREVVVLGRDVSGSNTDAIFTVRVKDGQTTITQIPRDSYIHADGLGPLKINGLLARGGPEAVERIDAIDESADRSSHRGKTGCDRNPAALVGDQRDVPEAAALRRSQSDPDDLQPGPQCPRAGS